MSITKGAPFVGAEVSAVNAIENVEFTPEFVVLLAAAEVDEDAIVNTIEGAYEGTVEFTEEEATEGTVESFTEDADLSASDASDPTEDDAIVDTTEDTIVKAAEAAEDTIVMKARGRRPPRTPSS